MKGFLVGRGLAWCLAAAPLLAQTREIELPDGMVERFEVQPGPDGRPVRDGDWSLRGPDGRVLASGQYAAGLRQGKWRWRDRDGDLRIKGAYKNGLRSGTWQFWHADRELLAEGKYERGFKSGAWTYFRVDGSADPDWSGVYERAEIAGPWGGRARGQLVDGRLQGEWLVRDRNGELVLRASFVRGRPAGHWDWWHADGTLDEEFVGGERGPIADWASLEREPLPWGAWNGLPPEPARSRSETPDPTRLPPPRGVPMDPETLHELDRALALVWGGDPATARREGARMLAFGRPAALAYALRELLRLGLDTEEDRARAVATERAVLAPALGGRAFDIEAHGALALLRYSSLLELTADNEDFWSFDLLPARGAEANAVLYAPPVLFGHASAQRSGEPGRWERYGDRAQDAAAAVEGALDWLARHQERDGSWDGDGFMKRDPEGDRCSGVSIGAWDTGLTALALLAILDNGETPNSGAHAQSARRALAWLLTQQDPATGRIGANVYEHAIAAQALARALPGVTSPAVRLAAQSAVDHALSCRNPYAGWRYDCPPTGENDTSVTGWMTAALRAARDAGLEVDPEAFQGALSVVTELTDPATGRVGYDRVGSLSARIVEHNLDYPPEAGEALTAMGLCIRSWAGGGEDPVVAKQIALLRAKLPEFDPEGHRVDMYYWLAAMHAAAAMDGELWERWSPSFLAAALESQRQEGSARGSWDPIGPWGVVAGRVYSTAVMALALEAGRVPSSGG